MPGFDPVAAAPVGGVASASLVWQTVTATVSTTVNLLRTGSRNISATAAVTAARLIDTAKTYVASLTASGGSTTRVALKQFEGYVASAADYIREVRLVSVVAVTALCDLLTQSAHDIMISAITYTSAGRESLVSVTRSITVGVSATFSRIWELAYQGSLAVSGVASLARAAVFTAYLATSALAAEMLRYYQHTSTAALSVLAGIPTVVRDIPRVIVATLTASALTSKVRILIYQGEAALSAVAIQAYSLTMYYIVAIANVATTAMTNVGNTFQDVVAYAHINATASIAKIRSLERQISVVVSVSVGSVRSIYKSIEVALATAVAMARSYTRVVVAVVMAGTDLLRVVVKRMASAAASVSVSLFYHKGEPLDNPSPRSVSVPVESRGMIVPAEDRTMVVPGENRGMSA